MLKVFIVLSVTCVLLNILNSIYVSRCNKALEMYFHALMPTLITMSIAIFFWIIAYISKGNLDTLMPINIISAIAVDIIFLVVNAFIVVSNGINRKEDNEVTVGLLFIFCLPIILFVSLPLELILYFCIKLKQNNNDGVKVVEEEIFDSLISASDYLK